MPNIILVDMSGIKPGVILSNGVTKLRIKNPWPGDPPGGTVGDFQIAWTNPPGKWLKVDGEDSPLTVPCVGDGNWPKDFIVTHCASWTNGVDTVLATLSHSVVADTDTVRLGQVMSVNIVEDEIAAQRGVSVQFHLSGASAEDVVWSLDPVLPGGAAFSGANTGKTVTVHVGAKVAEYTVRAESALEGAVFDTAILKVLETDEDPTSDVKTYTEDPINVLNGNCALSETDIVVPCPGVSLSFIRAYNSAAAVADGPLGPKWTHSLNWFFGPDRTGHSHKGSESADWKVLNAGDGSLRWFRETEPGVFEPPLETNWTLTETNGQWRLAFPGGTRMLFGADGYAERIEQAAGIGLTLTYDNEPVTRLIRAEHDNGQYLAFGYSDGRMVSATTPSETFSLSFVYNGEGELIRRDRATSGATNSTHYAYDGLTHGLTLRTNDAGDGFAYEYAYRTNAVGQILARAERMAMTGPVPYFEHDIAYEHPDPGQSLLEYVREGGTEAYAYGFDTNAMRVASIAGPDPDVSTVFQRDARLNIVGETRTNAVTGDFMKLLRQFDSRLNVTNETFVFNAEPSEFWNYEWHPDYDTLIAATNPEGGRVELEYENALPVSLKLYSATNVFHETRFAYTGDGLLAAVTNANNHWVRFAYDPWGFPTSSVPQLGPTVRTSFTRLGHLTELRLPGPDGDRVTAFDPDELGRVRRIDHPDGLYETMAYDSIGNLTNHTDRAGRRTDLAWLPARNLASVTRYLGEQPVAISFDYDQQFNTLHITDPLDRLVEAYALDIQARPVAVTNLEGQVMTVSYGLDDMVLSVQRFDGTVVSNEYDSAARLSAQHYPGGVVYYSWLGNGLPREAVNAHGSVSNAWDLAGRLTAQTQPAPGGTLHYSHDPVGNVTGVVGIAGPVRYAFDAAERLSEIQVSGLGPQPLSFLNDYNPYNGLLSSLTNATSGIFAEYAYSQMDELTNIVWRAGDGGVLRSFDYGYNAAGMITNVLLETGANIVYQYDDLDRLTGEIRSGEPGTFYGYDLAGNRTQTVINGVTNAYTLGLGNRLDTWTGGSYAQDAAGCVTNIVRAGKPDLALAWNGLYQLESIATNGVLAETYGHDALGRRLYTVQNGVTNWHVYDGIHVVADVDDNGAVLRSYTWGAGIDNLLAMTVHGQNQTNTYYVLTDHLGTVHAFADEIGAIVESYRFDAWGNVLGVFDGNGSPLSESALGNRYLFQGREYSWATGLYYFRARWYDPETGRWLSKDPIGINGGLNQFVAFDNNPVMFSDAFGMNPSRGERIAAWLDNSWFGRIINGVTGIDEVTYGIERTIRSSRGLPDPGPIDLRNRGAGFGAYKFMGGEFSFVETTVLRPDGRYRYLILSVRSGFGLGASLGPSMPSISADYSSDPCNQPADATESWRAALSASLLYGGAEGLEWNNFFWGSPHRHTSRGLSGISISGTFTYGTETVIHRRYLGPR